MEVVMTHLISSAQAAFIHFQWKINSGREPAQAVADGNWTATEHHPMPTFRIPAAQQVSGNAARYFPAIYFSINTVLFCFVLFFCLFISRYVSACSLKLFFFKAMTIYIKKKWFVCVIHSKAIKSSKISQSKPIKHLISCVKFATNKQLSWKFRNFFLCHRLATAAVFNFCFHRPPFKVEKFA